MKPQDFTSWDFGLGEAVTADGFGTEVGTINARTEALLDGSIRHSYRVVFKSGPQWVVRARLHATLKR